MEKHLNVAGEFAVRKVKRVLEVHRFTWKVWVGIGVAALILYLIGGEFFHNGLIALEMERLVMALLTDSE